MRTIFSLIILLMLITLLGCENSGDPVAANSRSADEQAILSNITEIEASDTADYFYADLNEESEDMFMQPGADFLAKPVVPLKFGRIGLRPILRDIRVEFTSDTTARVVFYKILHGKFMVVTMDTSYVFQRIDRKMGHKFKRIAYFAKRGNNGESLRSRWRMVATSIVEGQSLGVVDSSRVETTLEIRKLIIENEGNTLEIDDPLNFIQRKGDLITLTPGSEVIVTAYVKNDAADKIRVPAGEGTELVRLHFGRHRHWREHDMHGIRHLRWTSQTGDGINIYQGSWTVGPRFRINHAVIDVIDNGTIFNDDTNTYPYNSVTWGLPYKVKSR